MTTLAVQHTVSDFDTWKAAFDGHAAVRAQHGATNVRVLHDGNSVLVTMDFPDAAAVDSFTSDPSLREAMAKGGVIGAPTISVLTEAA